MDVEKSYFFKQCFSMLSEFLNPLGFTRSKTYTDPYNGNVVDFFLKRERITCIVSSDEIQVLSYIQGSFSEKVFNPTSQSTFDISEHMQKLCKNLEVSTDEIPHGKLA